MTGLSGSGGSGASHFPPAGPPPHTLRPAGIGRNSGRTTPPHHPHTPHSLVEKRRANVGKGGVHRLHALVLEVGRPALVHRQLRPIGLGDQIAEPAGRAVREAVQKAVQMQTVLCIMYCVCGRGGRGTQDRGGAGPLDEEE